MLIEKVFYTEVYMYIYIYYPSRASWRGVRALGFNNCKKNSATSNMYSAGTPDDPQLAQSDIPRRKNSGFFCLNIVFFFFFVFVFTTISSSSKGKDLRYTVACLREELFVGES